MKREFVLKAVLGECGFTDRLQKNLSTRLYFFNDIGPEEIKERVKRLTHDDITEANRLVQRMQPEHCGQYWDIVAERILDALICTDEAWEVSEKYRKELEAAYHEDFPPEEAWGPWMDIR